MNFPSNYSKANLLAKYAQKPVSKFHQFDGHERTDDIVTDCGGFGCTASETYELMSGAISVRVLIVPGTPADFVQKVLAKVADWYPEYVKTNVPIREDDEVFGLRELHEAANILERRIEREQNERDTDVF
jgi:hypothetical protein